MGLGKRRRERQGQFWVAADRLSGGPRNAFYDRLNELLESIGFDRKIEEAARPYYATTGRKGVPPGVYFRMLLVGFFEDIDSQRGIAWRCEDSKSLARFLGCPPGEETPDHSTLSLIRERLPLEVHHLAFQLVLKEAEQRGLLRGKTVAIDATDLEANASMKSIVRRDSGDDWREYVRKLYEEQTGHSDPTDEELRRFDKARKNKKVSNDEWVSETDPDARIGKMKDGRTHLKYKAEHAIDLTSEIIVAAEVYHGDHGDTATIEDTLTMAQTHLSEADTDCEIEETVADKGYHSEESVDRLQNDHEQRTYIPEPDRKTRRIWKNKPRSRQAAYRRNRRNTQGQRGRRLQRLRSERVERTFAHVCDTGGSRRTWLRGLDKIQKRYLIAAMAFNLARILRALLGAGKPKHLAVLTELLCFIHCVMRRSYTTLSNRHRGLTTANEPLLRADQFLAA